MANSLARKMCRPLLVLTLWGLLTACVLRSLRQLRDSPVVRLISMEPLPESKGRSKGPAVTLCPLGLGEQDPPVGWWGARGRPIFWREGRIATL